jgi:hypothetical protein
VGEAVRRIIRGVLARGGSPSTLIAGAGVAALTTLVIGLLGLAIAAWGLLFGAVWLSVVFRRRASFGALCLMLFVCYLAVGRPLADPAPVFCDVCLGAPRDPPFMALIGGCLLAGLGYGTGKLLRRLWLDPPGDRSRRLTLAVSWLAIPVLAGTVVVTQPAPAEQSFSFELGREWQVESIGYEADQDCSAYRATLDGAAPGTDYLDGLVILCVGVYEAADDFTTLGPGEACFRAQGGDPFGISWTSTPVATPAIAGSVERTEQTWNSDRMYGVAIGRQRWVGPVSENLCYWITVRLPSGSSVTESTVHAALATFRFK